MASPLYPGIGQPLYLASSNVQEPVWTGTPSVATAAIPSGSSSLGVSLTPGTQTDINVLYAAAPSGTAFNVMYDVSPAFSTEVVLQAVPATGSDKVYVWTTQNVRLSGFVRITNAGTATISKAYVQQTAVN